MFTREEFKTRSFPTPYFAAVYNSIIPLLFVQKFYCRSSGV